LIVSNIPTVGPASTNTISYDIEDDTTMGDIPESSAPGPAQEVPARRMGRSRRTITSRFKGFDDEVDVPAISSSIEITPVPVPVSQESGLFVSRDSEMETHNLASQKFSTQTRSSRKRPSPLPTEEEDEEDILDQLAPTATNIKRRRLVEDVARKRRGESTLSLPAKEAVPLVANSKPKKTPKEPIDVLEVARHQLEREEERAKAEREVLQEAMGDMDIDPARGLAVIEEMEVTRSVPLPRPSAHADEGDRWDDRWNGRKNFKKFRRRGETGLRATRRVIVPLEEVKKKDFGIGDDYWLEGDKETQSKQGKSRENNRINVVSQIRTQNASNRSQAPVGEIGHSSDIEIMEPVTDTQSSSTARSRGQTMSDKPTISQNKALPGKRAGDIMTKPAPVKKPKPATKRTRAESDDSEDGLGFRFRKKN
jgi:nijmegen breakage syndrome protein 1